MLFTVIFLLANATSAIPLPAHEPPRVSHNGTLDRRARDPVAQLLAIAPTSDSCANAPFPDECAVSSPAVVGALVQGFARYEVTTAAEQAALLSWMAFESGDFKYARNHFPAPGRPGQGTRCMMMPNFVAEYAASVPELAAGVVAAAGDPAALLKLVLPDQYAFAAASWFYATKCTEEQKRQVRDGGLAGWQSGFVVGCVQTTLDPARLEYWTRARRALGLPA